MNNTWVFPFSNLEKRFSTVVFVFIFSMLFFSTLSCAYDVASGDMLHLEVYGESELTLDVNVDSMGNIDYPLIGKVNVSGLEIDEIKQKITLLLKDGYFVNPQLAVYVKTFKPFYIQGQVNSPGSYSYEVGLTVRKAIALAGGLTERASKKKIYLTKASDKSQKEIKVNMDQQVASGDVILIKESFF